MLSYNRLMESMEIECDTCSDTEEYEGSFRACIEDAKEDGWKIKEITFKRYSHTCPSCNSYS